MVTVRTYWVSAEAALAKSVLDDYEIFCALIHENAHLYGRAPFAMPIRLVVDEDQAEQAIRILNGAPEAAAEIEATIDASLAPRGTAYEFKSSRPWEMLAIAFYFLLPGICVLQIQHPRLVTPDWSVRREIATVDVIHLLGWIAIIFAGFLLALYFYALRSSAPVGNLNDSGRPIDKKEPSTD